MVSPRKYVVTMISGGKYDLAARRVYNTCYKYVPAALLPPGTSRARTYDRLTIEIARQALAGGGNSIDVGAHDGGILRKLTELSSEGHHWAFEPIPSLAGQLQKRFPGVSVEQVALSDYDGWADFNYVPAAAAYSTLSPQLSPDVSRHNVHVLRVRVKRLDTCIPDDMPIAFMKIDVEGAESAVLRGAVTILRRCQPVVIFECASGRLGECVAVLEGAGLHVSLMSDYLAGTFRPAAEVLKLGRERGEFYYAASRQPAA